MVLVPVKVLGLKKGTAGAFAEPFRVLTRTNMTGNINVLLQSWCLFGMNTISSHAHKTGTWYLLRVLIKISDEPLVNHLFILLLFSNIVPLVSVIVGRMRASKRNDLSSLASLLNLSDPALQNQNRPPVIFLSRNEISQNYLWGICLLILLW